MAFRFVSEKVNRRAVTSAAAFEVSMLRGDGDWSYGDAMSNASAAARWIASLLEQERIPYVVVGGLAARAHGATRPLADIDLYVPTESLDTVARKASAHLTRPPARHVGDQWDIVFMQLEYAAQKIELGGADHVRIASGATGTWVTQRIKLVSAVWMDTGLGVTMPVMPRDDLVAYKRLLAREVDLEDVAQLEDPGN